MYIVVVGLPSYVGLLLGSLENAARGIFMHAILNFRIQTFPPYTSKIKECHDQHWILEMYYLGVAFQYLSE